jgi:CHAD domain-containing protein
MYMDKKRKKINKLLHKNPLQTSQLHLLRKQLKEFNYNQKGLNLKKQIKKLSKKDVLPDLLGKWHDCQIIIRHFEKTMKTGELKSKEITQLKTIKAKIVSENEVLFNRITILSHELVYIVP